MTNFSFSLRIWILVSYFYFFGRVRMDRLRHFSFCSPASSVQCLTRARIRQEQQEELVELRQDLQQVENLCRSVEEELRYEREKNLEVTKHDILTQKENVKVRFLFSKTAGNLWQFYHKIGQDRDIPIFAASCFEIQC